MKLIVNMSFLVARIGRYNAPYFHLFWPRGSGANLQCAYLHFVWADLWSSKFPLICQPSSFVVAFFLHSSVCIPQVCFNYFLGKVLKIVTASIPVTS